MAHDARAGRRSLLRNGAIEARRAGRRLGLRRGSEGDHMQIRTREWGVLEVPEERLVHMANGPLGFEDLRRFVLVEEEEIKPFLWMVCVDEPEVGFAVADPQYFHPGPYPLALSEIDEGMLDFAEGDDVSVFVIVTVSPESEPVANLRGPIVLNARNRLARQVVVYGSTLSVRQPLLRRRPVSLPIAVGGQEKGI
jgi:flagellar assembly factor FliW